MRNKDNFGEIKYLNLTDTYKVHIIFKILMNIYKIYSINNLMYKSFSKNICLIYKIYFIIHESIIRIFLA
jgi:hypothetical protein